MTLPLLLDRVLRKNPYAGLRWTRRGYLGKAGRKVLAITDRQFAALRVLWEHGPLTVRELMEHLPRGNRQPYTTALGLLQSMEKAGLVKHEKEGLTHRYLPIVSRMEATGSLLSDFVARFFHGSAEQLVLGLVDAQQLASNDLRTIEAKLSALSARASPENEGGRSSATPRRGRRKP
jgi:predicted transcriptional regulator